MGAACCTRLFARSIPADDGAHRYRELIANYLRLAPETVSRVLRRMQDTGLLAVDRREVQLLDRAEVDALAAPVLRE